MARASPSPHPLVILLHGPAHALVHDRGSLGLLWALAALATQLQEARLQQGPGLTQGAASRE